MELKEFVAETLKQIVEGVKDAQLAVKTEGAEINPTSGGVLRINKVEFDVALTVVEGKGAKGGGGIEVWGLLSLGGQRQASSENTSVSRIKFQVPIILPQQQG